MIQHYINHIILVVDASGSMSSREGAVVKVFDQEIAHLRERSLALNQETRVSVYLFSEGVECLVFDMDVMRMPSLDSHYGTGGQTALLHATLRAIEDNRQLPELYGDHAFLLYVLTDGEENYSYFHGVTSVHIRKALVELKENWTVAIMVPDARGKHEAKKFGFPEDSISIWDPNSRTGMEDAGKTFRSAIDNYMTMRGKGTRGTKGLFTLATEGLSIQTVKGALVPLRTSEYEILEHRGKDKKDIRGFVEGWTGDYRVGSAYYELIKPETIQPQKQVLVQRRTNGEVFQGADARSLVGLPDYEVKVSPGDLGEWRIFVQSTSVNRNVVPGQMIMVRK